MLAIYKREVRSYFNSMIGCVFAAFLTIIGGVYFMVYNLYNGYPFFHKPDPLTAISNLPVYCFTYYLTPTGAIS